MKRYLPWAAILLPGMLIACHDYRHSSPSFKVDDLMLSEVPKMEADLIFSPPPAPGESPNTAGYAPITENSFQSPVQSPLSTFSIDVDEASYANVRQFLEGGELPPQGAVRIEEMINYFDYDYPAPEGEQPFAVYNELSTCPWNTSNQLLHIGIKGKTIPLDQLPASNLVFLVDVSGSMDEPGKLPLVKKALIMLTGELRKNDKVAIVVYAGNAGLVLPSTNGTQKEKIIEAIDHLEAGGSTAGGEGLQLAYQVAQQAFITGGNNRIILATDGDFNIGPSSDDEMVALIEKERENNIFLSVLGFGVDNYQDSKMQLLADKGNGNHSYIDNENEARKVLVQEFGSTLFTIAKDVKIQVEFNPAIVQGYRLIGYENRQLEAADFRDDRKDAGELGSGHTVTALYEIIPAGKQSVYMRPVDSLQFQEIKQVGIINGDLAVIRLRYKLPEGGNSQLLNYRIENSPEVFSTASENFRFASAVAGFGLLLRKSPYSQDCNYAQMKTIAANAKGKDLRGLRSEFIEMVSLGAKLSNK